MSDVSAVSTGPSRVSRQVLVAAPAATLFRLVADPHRHHELDGSGTVQQAVEGPARLSLGATFTVAMKQGPTRYRITSRVTRFEPDRVLEWRHPVGHRWRWEFAPEGPETTRVTETFDYSDLGRLKTAFLEKITHADRGNAAGIEATLQKLHDRYRR